MRKNRFLIKARSRDFWLFLGFVAIRSVYEICGFEKMLVDVLMKGL